MALFKIFKGLAENLPSTKTAGYCWYTFDDSKFYIDYEDENGILQRKALNSQDAETIMGASLATILANSELEIPTSSAVIAGIDDRVELAKNQILDPDNYSTTSVGDSVVVVNFEVGDIDSSTGEDQEDEGHLRTDFIKVKSDKFTLYSDAPVESSIRVYVYDANKNWLSTANDVGYYRIDNGGAADITSQAVYIRCRISTEATSGTLTITYTDIETASHAVHKKIYFNNGYNMESSAIEDNLYQLKVNSTENEFNVFTIAAPTTGASEATLALMLEDDNKIQFVDLSCMKYHDDEDGTFSIILQSRGDTPLPSYVVGFNDGNGAGRVRKLEIFPDAIPMQFVSSGIRVRKDNTYDNEWTDDNSVIINLADLANIRAEIDSLIPKSTTVEILDSAWTAGDGYYSQVVTVNGVTANSKVDLQLTASQILDFQASNTSLVTENNNGTVTVYAIGNRPKSTYYLQALITEVIPV